MHFAQIAPISRHNAHSEECPGSALRGALRPAVTAPLLVPDIQRVHMPEKASQPRTQAIGLQYCTSMNNRALAVGLALLTILFVVLNFTVEDAGTIFLILAVAAGFGAGYYFRRS